MNNIKHVGKIKNTGSKVIVAFRTIPGESHQALVLPTATLPDAYHDAILQVLETDQAQQAFEFGEIMHVRHFPDGRPMLAAMSQDNRLQKVATANVIMTPTPHNEMALDQLNLLIAEQKNCTLDELCTFVSGAGPKVDKTAEVKEIAKVEDMDAPASVRAQASNDKPLTDKDIASSYRSQADALYTEAANLRKQADELDPPKKKATKVAEVASA